MPLNKHIELSAVERTLAAERSKKRKLGQGYENESILPAPERLGSVHHQKNDENVI